MRAGRVPLLILLLLTLAACSSGDADPTYNGSWSGSIDDETFDRADIELLLFQDDTELRGSWKLTRKLPFLPDVKISGDLTGTISEDGEAFELLLVPNIPAGACMASASGRRSGRFMTGVYETESGCIPALEGTFTLKR